MDFCKQFNARTQEMAGKIIPVVITVYKDKSFDFITKTPPVAVQIKEAAKLQKGSGEPNRSKVGSITWDQVRTIAETKMSDLNCFEVESAMSMVAGTARSLGVTVKGGQNHLSFAYGDKLVLNHVNLEIQKGQVVALIGQSGAGKTM